ncbi:hypothetical protein CEXT_550791 [Caerostris extrusa]|uniref:Uncharacterized protein n=1 Tax=Caerostris extrusa TaxID=172846 RepID=A0AAV4TZ47_CAEEX|nr:hypothetical protein CEXT_550791 [Caerostris extrusa]
MAKFTFATLEVDCNPPARFIPKINIGRSQSISTVRIPLFPFRVAHHLPLCHEDDVNPTDSREHGIITLSHHHPHSAHLLSTLTPILLQKRTFKRRHTGAQPGDCLPLKDSPPPAGRIVLSSSATRGRSEWFRSIIESQPFVFCHQEKPLFILLMVARGPRVKQFYFSLWIRS